MASCTHLDTITVFELPASVAGCEDELALLIDDIHGTARIPRSPMLSG